MVEKVDRADGYVTHEAPMRLRNHIADIATRVAGFLLNFGVLGCGFWYAGHVGQQAALAGLIAGYVGSLVFAVPYYWAARFTSRIMWGGMSAACWSFALPIASRHVEPWGINALGLIALLVLHGTLGWLRGKRRASAERTLSNW